MLVTEIADLLLFANVIDLLTFGNTIQQDIDEQILNLLDKVSTLYYMITD